MIEISCRLSHLRFSRLWLPKKLNGKTKWLQNAVWEECTIDNLSKLSTNDTIEIINKRTVGKEVNLSNWIYSGKYKDYLMILDANKYNL